MHRSQRTGALTWVMIRSIQSAPVRTTAPSRLDSSASCGSLTVTAAAAARSASTAGAMWRVWKAPATDSGRSSRLGGRVRGERGQLGTGPGGHDLPGAVHVGRRSGRAPRWRPGPPPRLRRAPRSCRFPAAAAARPWPGRGPGPARIASSAVITPAIVPAPSSPDAVPGRGAGQPAGVAEAAEELPGRGDGRRDQQRLRDGGVPDLVRVGRGPAPDEVTAGQVGPGGQPVGESGQLEPRGRGSQGSGHPGRARRSAASL